ncbi:hypothetical protein ACFDWB_005280 [Salmonella enterica]
MTLSRVCLDTESTGLSLASDALLEIAIISDTGVPLLNTLICLPYTFSDTLPEALYLSRNLHVTA